MWKKLLIVSVFIVIILAMIAPISSVHAKQKRINWRGTGIIVQNVLIMTNPPDPNSIIPHYLITISVRGAPGRAELTVLGYGMPDGSSDDCDMIIDIVQNEMAMKFSDGSLLFSLHNSGSLCIDYVTGTTFETVMDITGGTGRFKNVIGGQLTGHGRSYQIIGGTGLLSGERIKITGEIEFSD